MRVWSKWEKNVPKDAVYVGRHNDEVVGKWGNPFTVAQYGRVGAVKKYVEWLNAQPLFQDMVKKELRGKDLVCWCAPADCHADVLMELANRDSTEPEEYGKSLEIAWKIRHSLRQLADPESQ